MEAVTVPGSVDATSNVVNEQTRLFTRTLINRPLAERVVVYSSGTNRASDIRGVIGAGIPVGVDISRLSPSATRELLGSALPVFLDSGAFGEVSIQKSPSCVTHPINDSQWNARLDKYLLIARQLGGKEKSPSSFARVTIVAPDCVGNQGLTLTRLSKFRDRVRQVHAAGADVVVPMQIGSLNVVEFYTKAMSILDIEIVPGMPMKKAATTPEAIQDLIQLCGPRRIHLLGLGADNRKAAPIVRFIRHLSPSISISLDANRIRAAVGKNRSITRREKKHFDDVIPSWTGEVDLRESGGELHDLTEMLFQPSLWLAGMKLTQFANSLTWLTDSQRTVFMADPDSFVNADDNSSDWLHQSLMQAYFGYIGTQTRRSARTRAVTEALRESKIAYQI
jgi:hypothetical protein